MKVTYIGHSGFLVELEHTNLLFDYYTGTIPAMDPEKELLVFSSHNHHDHFNMDIFKLAEQYPHVRYILSWDIGKKFNKKFFLRHGVEETVYDAILFAKERSTYEMGEQAKIRTLHSTDEGVAFLVEVEEKHIYHAGDLNWWTWQEESEADNAKMTADYTSEIDRIAGEHFDLAFVVLDSRQEEDFWHGLDYFMKHTDTDLVYPMHFWEDDRVITRIKEMPEAADYAQKIAGVEHYKK